MILMQSFPSCHQSQRWHNLDFIIIIKIFRTLKRALYSADAAPAMGEDVAPVMGSDFVPVVGSDAAPVVGSDVAPAVGSNIVVAGSSGSDLAGVFRP
jgi:hypothetical protein